MPVGADAHRGGAPVSVGGDDAHRGKLGQARRLKRPVCETEPPSREPPPEACETVAGETAAAAAADAPRRRAALDRDQFEILIIREWTKTLKGPYDWADWPLARYTFAPGFLAALEQQRGLSATTLARTCAMVACGRAERLRSIDPRPRLDAEGNPLSRVDGAKAWSCHLRRDALAGARLDYWVLPGAGRIEFEAVVAAGRAARGATPEDGVAECATNDAAGGPTTDASTSSQDRSWHG
ncbi:MAG TPA: hypothetical protein VMU32_10865 [Solirubrobacteraceae bacterium]|nr:hypothetical protein [Solirubrobacteraceae bacterium]